VKQQSLSAKQNARLQQAIALNASGRLAEAAAEANGLLALFPQHPILLALLGTIALKQGNTEEAVILLNRSLKVLPNQPLVLCNCGVALRTLQRLEEALVNLDRAVALDLGLAIAHNNRGSVLADLQRFDEALASFDRAIALNPDYPEAHNNRGSVLAALKRFDEALASLDRATALNPDYPEAYNNRGKVLGDCERFDEALASLDRAIALNPDYPEAHNHRGSVLAALKRFDEALASLDRAIALKPDYAKAYNNRGNVLLDLRRFEEALASFNQAITLKPDFAEAYNGRGELFSKARRDAKARASYESAFSLRPDLDFLYGRLLYSRLRTCDWSNFGSELKAIEAKIARGEPASVPFDALALTGSLSIQRRAAETYAKKQLPSRLALGPIPQRHQRKKIRLGYYSADYRDHATTRLMAELFELHDKSRFDLIGISFGPERDDEMRRRVAAAFGTFTDVRGKNDREVARLSRELEIDIAVDLKGFTENCRPGIFADRAAPVQVNYLGFPGTMGADYIDYIIADKVLIPAASQPYYSEKVVYLPDSYQVNDRKRKISDRQFRRDELGLPPAGFVFCCFNNNYKITPSTFDVWMRILKQVEGSVLWLLESNPEASANLGREAEKRGVSAERLIPAKQMSLPEHLARQRSAELFLDTLPYNAHTTASDALWAGLPVLTCAGESFASRVTASLLNAIDLPELITNTLDEYEALAVELATNPSTLAQIKQKLLGHRLTTPLFDTPLFARHIEAAYSEMHERYLAGLPPDHIVVTARS